MTKLSLSIAVERAARRRTVRTGGSVSAERRCAPLRAQYVCLRYGPLRPWRCLVTDQRRVSRGRVTVLRPLVVGRIVGCVERRFGPRLETRCGHRRCTTPERREHDGH